MQQYPERYHESHSHPVAQTPQSMTTPGAVHDGDSNYSYGNVQNNFPNVPHQHPPPNFEHANPVNLNVNPQSLNQNNVEAQRQAEFAQDRANCFRGIQFNSASGPTWNPWVFVDVTAGIPGFYGQPQYFVVQESAIQDVHQVQQVETRHPQPHNYNPYY